MRFAKETTGSSPRSSRQASDNRIGSCESCRRQNHDVPVCQTAHNKAPIEVQPSDDGNILVTGTQYEIVPAADREKVKAARICLRKNSFCYVRACQAVAKKKPASLANVCADHGGTISAAEVS